MKNVASLTCVAERRRSPDGVAVPWEDISVFLNPLHGSGAVVVQIVGADFLRFGGASHLETWRPNYDLGL